MPLKTDRSPRAVRARAVPLHSASRLAALALVLAGAAPASAAPPVISQFDCPVFLDQDCTEFYCEASYSGNGAATVEWFGIDPAPVTYDDGAYTWYAAVCDVGQRVRVTLRVTNADGSAWRSALFNCGPP